MEEMQGNLWIDLLGHGLILRESEGSGSKRGRFNLPPWGFRGFGGVGVGGGVTSGESRGGLLLEEVRCNVGHGGCPGGRCGSY